MTELIDNEGVWCRRAAACLLCDREGHVVYAHLRDRWLSVPGVWDVRWCGECELAWLDPRPLPEEASRLYPEGYSTHRLEESGRWRRTARRWLRDAVLSTWLGYDRVARSFCQRSVGAIFGWPRLLRDRAELAVMALPASRRGRVLDVGCGNGRLLAELREFGWEVQGVEPDDRAARIARHKFGIPVEVATIREAQIRQKFHAVLMNHVIEHLDDPLRDLVICRSWLEPGGQLVVTTPNVRSVGHRFWRSSWRGLDPPRHFFLFSLKSLRSLLRLAGYVVSRLGTTSRGAAWCWEGSSLGGERRKWCAGFGGRHVLVRASGALVELAEGLWPVREFGGEELVAICSVGDRNGRADGVAENASD